MKVSINQLNTFCKFNFKNQYENIRSYNNDSFILKFKPKKQHKVIKEMLCIMNTIGDNFPPYNQLNMHHLYSDGEFELIIKP